MNYKGLPIALVQRVSYTEAQQYALSKGWQRVPGVKGDIAVYRRPESRKREVIIPQDRGFSDYALRMAEAIAAFTDYERLDNDQRRPQQVLNDLLLPAADILRFSLEGTAAQDGTVPLGEAVNLIEGARKALIASACTVIHPQKFHPRMSRTEAEQFINTCRFGQTEQGSFVTTFICPLNAREDEDFQLSGVSVALQESFTRKVTRILVFSLNQIVEAVKADHPDTLVNPKTRSHNNQRQSLRGVAGVAASNRRNHRFDLPELGANDSTSAKCPQQGAVFKGILSDHRGCCPALAARSGT